MGLFLSWTSGYSCKGERTFTFQRRDARYIPADGSKWWTDHLATLHCPNQST